MVARPGAYAASGQSNEWRSDESQQGSRLIRPFRAIRAWLRNGWEQPARVIAASYVSVIAAGTALLMLPVSTIEVRRGSGFFDALFTSTSAVCVTGLTVRDPEHWTLFGQVTILVLIQIGGAGIMTVATLLGILVARRMGLRSLLTAAMETRTLSISDVRRVARGVFLIDVIVESLVAVPLVLRLWLGYDESFPHALFSGVFHSVSAFNNAGFSLYSSSMERFATDPVIILPISLAIILGGLGFPVLFQLARRFRKRIRWTLHAKMTLITTVALLAVGWLAVTAMEWENPDTLGPMGAPGKLLAGFFGGVTPRTAGFNSIDVDALRPATLLITVVLMFIGAGSASTGGGIKVTTFALLLFVIRAEARGEQDVELMGRRVPAEGQRQALGVAMLSLFLVIIATLVILLTSPFGLRDGLFEAVSAFSNTGLSTGITPSLPHVTEALLVVVMLAGRLGPITFVSALALHARRRYYKFPEERPIVG